MIDIYDWPTPKGHKIIIFREEAGLPHTIKPVNLQQGSQFKPDFLKILPNNRSRRSSTTRPPRRSVRRAI